MPHIALLSSILYTEIIHFVDLDSSVSKRYISGLDGFTLKNVKTYYHLRMWSVLVWQYIQMNHTMWVKLHCLLAHIFLFLMKMQPWCDFASIMKIYCLFSAHQDVENIPKTGYILSSRETINCLANIRNILQYLKICNLCKFVHGFCYLSIYMCVYMCVY